MHLNDYNTYRPNSSINYLTPVEFEKQGDINEEFRNKFIEEKKLERRLKSRKIKIWRGDKSVSMLH